MYVFYNWVNNLEAILIKHTPVKSQKPHEATAVLNTVTVVQTS
jgi:hypothetical protein